MTVELATIHDIKKIKNTIPIFHRTGLECIDNNLVYVLHDEEHGNAIVGILRYSTVYGSQFHFWTDSILKKISG
ncbi:MAG: hypothetical protein ACLR23_00725 [Clostridia bacterium]